MHTFDPLSINSTIVRLKSVSLAVGGSMVIIDEDASTEENEVTKRVSIPLAVARDFIQRCDKVSKYIEPILVNIVWYQNIALVMERIPDMNTDVESWNPISKLIADAVVNRISKDEHDWYFDGRYIYRFESNDVPREIAKGDTLTEDGAFRTVAVQAINTMRFHERSVDIAPRACIAMYFDHDHYAVSAPIWQSTSGIGKGHLSSDEDEESKVGKSNVGSLSAQFDTIDEKLCVNLEFALRAGRSLRTMFGSEQLEPLELAKLMIDLRTVNLPALPSSVKSTYAIGLSFTHAMAWMLGFVARSSNDIGTVVELRALVKHLTGRGIARKSSVSVSNIYEAGHIVEIGRLDWQEAA